MSNTRFKLVLAATALSAILAACGGGGGGGSSGGGTDNSSGSTGSTGSTSTSGATSGNQTTPQYASGSIEASAFQLLNQQRQQCGFPALSENTYLDKGSAAHANYEQANNSVGDKEKSGLAGYTGADYQARAVAAGYPSGISVGGVSTGFWTSATLTNDEYAQHYILGLLSGVYHVGVLMSPTTDVGVGSATTTYSNFPEQWAAISFGNPKAQITNGPLTFPCQGTTGVAYAGAGETPTPPNVSSQWGTPVDVTGNFTDTITLTSGTMTDSSGNTITLQLLDSANDPNKELAAYEATAYPSSALTPNTTYSVSITGTDNGVAFSRTFSFTTGNLVG